MNKFNIQQFDIKVHIVVNLWFNFDYEFKYKLICELEDCLKITSMAELANLGNEISRKY
jgi:hypothetical protein